MPNTRKNTRDLDSPFVTAEGMRRAAPFRQRFPGMDTPTVMVVADPLTRRSPKKAALGKAAPILLPRDVVAELRATGPGWQELAERLLRAALKRRRRAVAKAAQT